MEGNVPTFNCPQCGAPLNSGAKDCRYCGETFAQIQQTAAAQQAVPSPAPTPIPVVQTVYVQQSTTTVIKPVKSRKTAGILAILLGGIGAHKFYLGKPWLGLLYLLFCWTYIPEILGIIEGILYLTMSDEAFAQKYGVIVKS